MSRARYIGIVDRYELADELRARLRDRIVAWIEAEIMKAPRWSSWWFFPFDESVSGELIGAVFAAYRLAGWHVEIADNEMQGLGICLRRPAQSLL